MNTFILIVLGQIVSLFGNAALRFALPLYLLRQTGSAALYGGITALAMLPALAGMLTGGALADRCRKARLMALLDLVTAGIAAAAAAGLPHLPLLPLVLTVLGSLYAIQGLYQPVVRACLPLLLNGTQLLCGNAVIQLVDTVDELLGPLLGAVLLEHLGIRGLLVLCGGCFALSAGMELCLRIPQDVPYDTKLSVRSLWADLRESAQFLTGQAAVLRLAAAMAAVNLLEVPALTVGVPVLVVQTLQKSDASLGLVQAVLSAGGILGGVLAGTIFVRHPIRSGTPLLLALSGVCAALGLALRVSVLQFGSILVLGAVFMAVAALFNVWFFAQLQVLVPQAQLGKTTACCTVLACLTQPIGQAAYGIAFQHWAAHPADVLLAAGVLSALVLWLLQTRRTVCHSKKGAAVAAPFMVCLLRQLCRVEVAFALLYLHMDVALLGALAADSAHRAKLLPGGHGVPGLYGRICHTAQPPAAAGSIFQHHHGAPVALCPGRHYLARHGCRYRSALRAGVVHAVVGAPVAQRLVIHQLLTTEGVEHAPRHRGRGGRLRRTAGRRGCALQCRGFAQRTRARLRTRGCPRGRLLRHICLAVCNVGHGLLPCGVLLCVPVRFCFRGGLLGGAGGV